MSKYVVTLQPSPSREEQEWAWRFTVLANARGACQHCGAGVHLDVCHIIHREARPDLEWEPGNGVALCRSCHMRMDHANNHRPSGRPVGLPHTPESRAKMSAALKALYADPEELARKSERARRQWDRVGRKVPKHAHCQHCGSELSQYQRTHERRFCSAPCHYAFRSGKPRSGY